jgi:ribonuclease BN (tRNA processing enzyme)
MADGARVRAQIRCWGVRGTCPSPGAATSRFGGNTPCVEVRTADGAIVVLDGGTGLRRLGATLEAEPKGGRGSPADTAAPASDQLPPVYLFFSHLHCDHVIGLPHFAPMFNNHREIELRCGQSSPAELRALVESMFRPPLFPPITGALERVGFLEWDAAGSVQVGASCRVRRLAARHPGGASIITVEDDAGLILAYAPDNELGYAVDDATVQSWRTSLAERLQGVPVLLHDATYLDDELPSHAGWGHSSANEAARFAASCNAGQLQLFHHHPDRDDDAVTQMVSDATAVIAALGSRTVVHGAMEGTTVVV